MDGIHDLGGRQGFGRVIAEADEPVFHADWQARMFALAIAAPYAVSYGDDLFRPAIEAMDPVHYLTSSYYEKWYVAVTRLLLNSDAITDAELASGSGTPTAVAALPADAVLKAIHAGASQACPGTAARFQPGERVITARHRATRHTRLPHYARGKTGVVERVQGGFLVADANAAGKPKAESLYTVVFDCRDLWGSEAAAGDRLSLDLWESYLEPAS